MRLLLVLLASIIVTGCASNYGTYVETQRALNKDYTVAELARIAALTDIVRETSDPNVRIQAIRALQDIQRSKKPLEIKPPSLFGF